VETTSPGAIEALSLPELSIATRLPLFVIQILPPFEAISTNADSLFLASKVPTEIVLSAFIPINLDRKLAKSRLKQNPRKNTRHPLFLSIQQE
jgi:hypothetical protein